MKRRVMLAVLLACLVAAAGCGNGAWSSGDRVLVAKFLSEVGLKRPERWDVVVFKFPQRPVKNGVPKNYIKRLLGLSGELLAILFGRIYVATANVSYDDSNVPENDRWQAEWMHSEFLDLSSDRGKTKWDAHRFAIQRKPLDTLMAMRRLVNDNDFQPKGIEGKLPPRWAAAAAPTAWAADGTTGFRHSGASDGIDWLRYRHLTRPRDGREPRPKLITDIEGYNQYSTGANKPEQFKDHNWVGELMLECKLKVDTPKGEFVMELSKGVDRFRAAWDLASGDCTLYRIDKDGKPQQLDRKATDVKAAGEYDLRFANVDARLTVWVNGRLPFDNGHVYAEATERGPTANDLEPASLGAKGAAVRVSQMKLWRDTYYTLRHDQSYDYGSVTIGEGEGEPDWSDPGTWGRLRRLPARTLYVQPGHFLCLGDNSPQSSDSRDWGTVPERLMLGRALLVYYPFWAPFPPFSAPINRVGPIK